jgi:hypothetical protein
VYSPGIGASALSCPVAPLPLAFVFVFALLARAHHIGSGWSIRRTITLCYLNTGWKRMTGSGLVSITNSKQSDPRYNTQKPRSQTTFFLLCLLDPASYNKACLALHAKWQCQRNSTIQGGASIQMMPWRPHPWKTGMKSLVAGFWADSLANRLSYGTWTAQRVDWAALYPTHLILV